MLCPAWPVATRATMAVLEQLGDTLGNDHDLALLQQFVGEHADIAPDEAAALDGLIAAREMKLQAAALKLGRRLYTATPKALCLRLREDWQAWRGPGDRN